MKTSRLAALAAAAFTLCAFNAPLVHAATDGDGLANPEDYPLTEPIRPRGSVSAFPVIVQTGTHPTLNWNIIHPAKIGGGGGGGGGNGNGKDIAIIHPPGTIIPVEDVYLSVQIIGSGVTDCKGNSTQKSPPTDLRFSVDGSSYQQLFYGTQSDVNPGHVLYTKKIYAGQAFDLGGRYVINGGWSSFFTTRNPNMQVVALTNGSPLPMDSKFQGQAAMANYLKPYLDAGNNVRIGPLSVLVLMEFGQTDMNSPCFDQQDQVVLVTLSRKHPKNNNGHGNNLDGVDVSNPGGGSGGPNGEVDPSGDFDDEK